MNHRKKKLIKNVKERDRKINVFLSLFVPFKKLSGFDNPDHQKDKHKE